MPGNGEARSANGRTRSTHGPEASSPTTHAPRNQGSAAAPDTATSAGPLEAEREGSQLSPRAVWRLLGAVALVEALDHMPSPPLTLHLEEEEEGCSLAESDAWESVSARPARP